MPAEPADFAALVARFGGLGKADRRAVLAGLSAADQERVAAAIAAHAQTGRSEAEAARRAGRQYAAYSPWLAAMVRRACADEAGQDTVGAAARRAIAEAHAEMQADAPTGEGLASALRGWWNRLLEPGTAPT